MDKFLKEWKRSNSLTTTTNSDNEFLSSKPESQGLITIPAQHSDDNENKESSTTDDQLMDVSEAVGGNQKKMSTHRNQAFRTKWLSEFEWLDQLNGKSFCKYCQIKITNNNCHLLRHETSLRHQKSVTALKHQPKIRKQAEEFESLNKKLKLAELKIIMFILSYNLPFLLITPLVDLIKCVAVDSEIVKKIKIGKTKATETVKSVLLVESNKSICEILQKQKFSMIIDETTDVSTTKCLTIVVRYFDKIKLKIRDRFLAMVDLEYFDAVSIYQTIKKVFADLCVPLGNCIGFASDNAAVMFGKNNSVKSLLMKDNPNIFSMGCICHSIHLCSAAASKALPTNVEYLIRNV